MASVPVGRIIYTRQALPAVDLVSFTLDRGDIIIRTDRSGTLGVATRKAVVAFEADSLDPAGQAGWSVTVIGQSHEVTANIKPPQGVDATTFPVYSGFIHVTSGNDSVHATYLGLAASLKDKQVIDNTDAIFGLTLPLILDASGNPQNASVNYTFVGADAPTILWRQAFGSPVLRLDLVPANTTFTGTLNARGNGEPNSFATPHKGGSFAKVPVLGTLLEIDWLSRNDEINLLDNTLLLENAFANGTTIPNGSYKVLLRSLRVTGDATNEADYESWLSPIIGVAA